MIYLLHVKWIPKEQTPHNSIISKKGQPQNSSYSPKGFTFKVILLLRKNYLQIKFIS